MESSMMSTLATKQRCLAFVGAITSAAAAIHCSPDRQVFVPTADEAADAAPPPIAPFADASVEEASVPEPDVDCSDENKQIYVLSANDKAIYRFDPMALTFSRLGRPACPTRSGMYSMAVDRRGIAWIEYQDGRVFKVNTTDMSCSDSGFRRDAYGFGLFGMGFAKNDGDTGNGVSAGETLWVVGAALARLDTTTLELSIVGKGGLGRAELSGTGVGTLYAFMSGSGGRVAQLDKETGDVQKLFRTGVANLGAWAFAAWGGDFWLFTTPETTSGTETSTVTKYSPATDMSTVLMEETGLQIVGAGVSTCAPTEPPH
jgi:hypothetical protein